MATLINTLMAALSSLIMPAQEEPKLADVILRHEIVQVRQPLIDKPPSNCCLLN